MPVTPGPTNEGWVNVGFGRRLLFRALREFGRVYSRLNGAETRRSCRGGQSQSVLRRPDFGAFQADKPLGAGSWDIDTGRVFISASPRFFYFDFGSSSLGWFRLSMVHVAVRIYRFVSVFL